MGGVSFALVVGPWLSCDDPDLVNVAVVIPYAAMGRDWGVGSRQDEVPRWASQG